MGRFNTRGGTAPGWEAEVLRKKIRDEGSATMEWARAKLRATAEDVLQIILDADDLDIDVQGETHRRWRIYQHKRPLSDPEEQRTAP